MNELKKIRDYHNKLYIENYHAAKLMRTHGSFINYESIADMHLSFVNAIDNIINNTFNKEDNK